MTDFIPSDVARSIESFLATGRYDSRDDVLRSALEALRQRDENTDIAAGISDMEAGRYRPFAEVDAEFRRRHQIVRGD